MNSTTAMATPSTVETVVRMSPTETFQCSAIHLESLDGSSSSATATSELRRRDFMPSTREETKLTTPRTKGNRIHFFCFSGGVMRLASSCISPVSSRTQVAMPLLERIMTPWMTAWPPI